ncbi:MAG: quinoprotein relay system zinc metallohydrolase 2 [Methylophilales bacterium]|nr:quinoprotein relay system zinc metallohydrolase 2 [Methylophilales bacterium]
MKKINFDIRLAPAILAIFFLLSATQVQSADFGIEDLGNGIYVHHGAHLDIDTGYQGDICNISFVVGSRGVAVIDTGGSLKVGKQLRAAIKAVTPLPILYVINTHVHPDHIFGNAAFVQDNPVFVGHAKLGDTMQLRQEAYTKLNIKYLGADAEGSDMVKPSLVVSTGSKLDLGDRSLQLTDYVSAHTVTDISLIDSKTQTLFTGDLLFIERTPVIESDIKGLIAAIDSLKSSQVSQVVPGHGPFTKDWIVALNNERLYLEALLTDIRANIKNGVSMEKTMETAAASEKNKWMLFDVANRRNVNTIYPILEWE